MMAEFNAPTRDLPALAFELGFEELPPALTSICEATVEQCVSRTLRERAGMNASLASATNVQAYSTNRRIGAQVREFHVVEAQQKRVKGPSVTIAFGSDGSPTPAGMGFAKRHAMEASDLRTDDTHVYLEVTKTWPSLSGVARHVVDDVIEGLRKLVARVPHGMMRWSCGDDPTEHTFYRPLRYGALWVHGQVMTHQALGVSFGATLRSHRSARDELACAGDPLTVLRDAHIEPRYAKRVALIESTVKAAAEQSDAEAEPKHVADGWRLNTLARMLACMVERPVAITLKSARSYLHLPHFLLAEAMWKKQQYMPLYQRGLNELSGDFVALADLSSAACDDLTMQTVTTGNERVARARLDDAGWAFQLDEQQGLGSLLAESLEIPDLPQSGMLKTRAAQVTDLWLALCKDMPAEIGGDLITLHDAWQKNASDWTGVSVPLAGLIRADLASATVREFPDVQRHVGCELLRRSPRVPDDVTAALVALIAGTLSRAMQAEGTSSESMQHVALSSEQASTLGLADQLYELACHIKIETRVSGSRDPFGLRRLRSQIATTLVGMAADINIYDLLQKGLLAVGISDGAMVTSELALQGQTLGAALLTAMRARASKHEAYVTAAFHTMPLRQWSIPYLQAHADVLISRSDDLRTAVATYGRMSGIVSLTEDLIPPVPMKTKVDAEFFTEHFQATLLAIEEARSKVVFFGVMTSGRYREWLDDVITQSAALAPMVEQFVDETPAMTDNPQNAFLRNTVLRQASEVFLRIGPLPVVRSLVKENQ